MPDFNINANPNIGNSPTSFVKNFFKGISSKLPYNLQVIENIEELNPSYKHFFEISKRKDEILNKLAVSVPKRDIDKIPFAEFLADKNYQNYIYGTLDPDKPKRLLEYRLMASYSKLANAIDEICNECIVKDDRGNIVNLDIQGEFNDIIKKEIEKEWKKFITLFELEYKGREYFRSFLIDGEIFFENIISGEHKSAGILGIKVVPTEYCNPVYENIVNNIIASFLVKIPKIQISKDARNAAATEEKIIPFDKNQITYIQSGIWNENKSFRVPFIERGRRAYKQLTMIEDSIVMYRLVRSTERLVFNVDVGDMPQQKAEQYLQKLMHSYWSTKTYDPTQGKSINSYNPQSMLDNFWFAKRRGNEGVSVQQLQGGAALSDLPDLNYFHAELLKALKVPTSRIDPNAGYADGAEITREELRFAKFVIELQNQFVAGLKQAFIIHLKLRELWKQYDLKENNIYVKFNEPTHFNELRKQQIFELRFNNFDSMSGNASVSSTYAQKKYLGWNDEEILQNRSWQKKDAQFKWEIAQIEANGPNWREAIEAANAAENAASVEAGGEPSGGKGKLPPSFGPGPGSSSENLKPKETPKETPKAGGSETPPQTPATSKETGGEGIEKGAGSKLP